MTGQLITLPVRLGLRGTRLMIHVAEGVSDFALGSTLRVAGTILGVRPRRRPRSGPGFAAPARVEPVRARHRTGAPDRIGRVGVQRDGAGELASERLERQPPTRTVPRTRPGPAAELVSEEPDLVFESAEPGAEEGAGASVNVHEPWAGYQRMNARAVILRLHEATMAELTAVQLYERAHRARRTVLEAVKRELRTSRDR